MSNPTRFTSGVTTVPPSDLLGSYPLPEPFHTGSTSTVGVCAYENDFCNVGGTEYTATGSATFPVSTTIAGGAAVLTPSGATTAGSVYKTGQSFQFQAGNRFWYATRVQASAVSGTKSFYVGLQAGSSVNDGLWFSKAASSTSVNLVSTVGSTATTLVTGVATAAAATWLDVGFYFNGVDLQVFVNNALVARVSAPTIGSSGTKLTNAILTPVFQITPTATDTLTVDYVLAAQEITR
jgi:hypothetical protein